MVAPAQPAMGQATSWQANQPWNVQLAMEAGERLDGLRPLPHGALFAQGPGG